MSVRGLLLFVVFVTDAPFSRRRSRWKKLSVRPLRKKNLFFFFAHIFFFFFLLCVGAEIFADSISGFIMLSIKLQEQNVAPQPALRPAAEGVVQVTRYDIHNIDC